MIIDYENVQSNNTACIQNGLKQGQITITMKDGKSHTIDLSQKLEKNVWVILSTADNTKILVEMK